MKIFIFALFLYFSILATCGIYAGNNTLLSSYPAPNGSYNKVTLQNLSVNPDCTQASNAGQLFIDTSTNTLQMCTKDGTNKPVPYNETCFNRFCSCTAGGCSSASCNASGFTGSPCPAGYVQGKYTTGGVVKPINDPFTTSAGYTVYSTVCCNGNGTPNGNSTVLPTS